MSFFAKVGLPRIIQMDSGSNFMSKIFWQLTKQLGIAHMQSSAYHPHSQVVLE